MRTDAKKFSIGNVVLPGDFRGFDEAALDHSTNVAQGDAATNEAVIHDSRDVVGGLQDTSVPNVSDADTLTIEVGLGIGSVGESAAIASRSVSSMKSSSTVDESRFAPATAMASPSSRGDDASAPSSAAAPVTVALPDISNARETTSATPSGAASSDLANVAASSFQAGVGDSFPLASEATFAGVGAIVNGKLVGTVAQLADYLINGFWQFVGDVAHHFGSSTITYNIAGLNTAEKFLAQSALNAWHEVANVNFVLVTIGTANVTFNHNGSMTAFETDNSNAAGITTVATIDISADWITTDGGARDGKTGIDSYGYQTYIHEIGHALGLGHQGPYNGSATYLTNAAYANDTSQYSVMSYFSQQSFDGGSDRYVITPEVADIYAVGLIYGAAATRSGDTTYGFHNSAGSIFDFSAYTQAPALTIYDSGGNDTLDCSGYSVAQTIDLHAGAFSSVGGLVHNIGIAVNAVIENAIGGSGNDTLIANDAGNTLRGGGGNDTLLGGAGADTLIGGVGVDTMTGGAGADIFSFTAGDSSAAAGQHDLITDFMSGTDHIDLTGIDANTSTPGIVDAFRWIATSVFDGIAGALNYYFDAIRGATVLQGDTNGDRAADFAIDLRGNIALAPSDLIGVVFTTTVIESAGSTSLNEAGNHFYLYGGGGSGPSLKHAGADFVAGQFGGWAPIGAEVTASGYEVAWKFTGADQYTVWSTDSSGNFISNIPIVSGMSNALESLETSFHQDLNSDGVIGLSPATSTVIESNGSTSLTKVGSEFYLYSSIGSGPALKYGGSAVVTGEFGAWAPIGAEVTASGYEVAWKFTGADQYTVWSTDSSGNFISNIPIVSGTSSALESLETSFHQDLNGDGRIGLLSLPAATPFKESAAANDLQNGGAAGNHTVAAAGPNTTLISDGGHDTFVFNQTTLGSIGAASITNFDPADDVINISSALASSVTAYDDNHGSAMIIVDTHGDTINLIGVHAAALHASNFHIV